MVNHSSEHDSEILHLQREQVELWFDIAFERYGWLNKQIHGEHYESQKTNGNHKEKTEIVPKDLKFAPYNRSESK
ncbi:7487_t:CDS:2 [Funneliformis mosseae]|uniref:7487_t:CDS:1 n=1 Tax=Funneliformis mosseae TaxID=27381 RepID=A0A9N8W8P2_FUNMO|nr:7487_t:CDS:2 [Funneliformis mosseae]